MDRTTGEKLDVDITTQHTADDRARGSLLPTAEGAYLRTRRVRDCDVCSFTTDNNHIHGQQQKYQGRVTETYRGLSRVRRETLFRGGYLSALRIHKGR